MEQTGFLVGQESQGTFMRKHKPSHLRESWDPIFLLSGSPPCGHPPVQTYRKTPSLEVSWGGEAECGETSVLCPLA